VFRNVANALRMYSVIVGAGIAGNYLRGAVNAGNTAAYNAGQAAINRWTTGSSVPAGTPRRTSGQNVRYNPMAVNRTPNSRPLASRVRGRRTRGRMWRTTGRYMGRYKFRRIKRRQMNIKRSQVILEERIDDGGVQVGPQTVAVACSSSPRGRLLRQLCQAIYHKMISKLGAAITDWNQGAPFITWGIDFKRADNSNVNASTGWIAAATHYSIANTMAVQITAQFNAPSNELIPIGTRMTLWTDNTLSVILNTVVIQLDNFMININHNCELTVQNRTIAEATEGGDSDLATNVSNNPLVGYSYLVNPGTALIAKNPNAITNNYLALLTDADRGFGSASYDVGEWIKPPKSNFFQNVKGSLKVMLAPGAIKKWSLSYNKTHSFRVWLELYGRMLFAANPNRMPPYGKTVVVFLEKMLDTRTDEPNIEIGFQTDVNIKVKYKYKEKNYVNPFMAVGTASV